LSPVIVINATSAWSTSCLAETTPDKSVEAALEEADSTSTSKEPSVPVFKEALTANCTESLGWIVISSNRFTVASLSELIHLALESLKFSLKMLMKTKLN
jgi:hypothetical protein